MDKQREMFEAWWKWNRPNYAEDYNLHEHRSWNAWQAAIAAQWQPIETAPKDGAVVITYRNSHNQLFIFASYYDGDDWMCAIYDEPVITPTHWMPRPPEPTK